MSTNNLHTDSRCEQNFSEIDKRLFNCKPEQILENIHFIRDGTSNVLLCVKCRFYAKDKLQFEVHYKYMHLPSGQRNCCRLGFITKYDFLNHTSIYHKYGYFCWFCKNHVSNKNSLEEHFISAHATESYLFLRAASFPHCKEFAQLAEAGHPYNIMSYQFQCQIDFSNSLQNYKMPDRPINLEN